MKYFSLFIFSILLLVFSGCGGAEKISVSFHCDNDCNESNAVVVKIYQLKNADKFTHASFESLLRSPDETLGDDLIAGAKYEKLMTPDESFKLSDYEIKKDAAYIGVVGDFHTPAKDGWFQVIPVKDIDDLSIKIHSNSLTVEKGE
jgi:type VI secretion system VasD/TssJ family lipoprotein